jgi:hypothetical protein
MDRPSTVPLDSRNPSFIPVQCSCGRSLRAKLEQVGTEIRCWDCHKSVTVSLPRDRQVIGRELTLGFRDVVLGPGLRYVLVTALVLTAAFCIPWVGLIVGGLVLTVGAALYGEVIRRVSPGGRSELGKTWGSILFPRSFVKPILCILMAAGTVIPLWVLNAGMHRSPRWTVPTALLAGLAWSLLPILMLATYGSDKNGRLGIRRSLTILARHPFAAILAIAIIPAILLLTDVAIGQLLYSQDYLVFIAFDLMPLPPRTEFHNGIPYLAGIDYRNYPQSSLLDSYFDGIRHGYTLSAAIPTSLSLPTRAGLNPDGYYTIHILYDIIRVLLTMVIVTCLIAGFAVQAMWLGAIAGVGLGTPQAGLRRASSS